MILKAVLFDLDGTLVDTAPDMVGSLNRVLVANDRPEVAYEGASKLVSNGARALIEHGFGATDEEFKLQRISEFLADYAAFVAHESTPYTGMRELLAFCAAHNIRWGVVTNKPLGLARDCLDGLGLLADCSILLGGDSLPVKKPDPAPLLHCCMTLDLAASECLYIGDHQRDIEAGNRAGMETAAALWGYIDRDQKPDTWQADYLLESVAGLKKLIEEKLH